MGEARAATRGAGEARQTHEDRALSDAELAALLERTSRTFALAIPLLGDPLARQVGAAYLVFRLADTLEDAPLWGRDARLAGLRGFAPWLEGGAWPQCATAPTSDAGCLELIARAGDVRTTVDGFPERARRAVVSHAKRTAEGMAEFVARQREDGSGVLRDLPDLSAYCYVVAGIVGEMLTELFVLASPSLEGVQPELAARAAAFGEGLQLVNILKDGASDAGEGRVYVPPGVPRSEVFALARADLARAGEYVALLAKGGAPETTRAFCELPVQLAVATLDRLEEGAPKLARDEVLRIHASVTDRARASRR
jgi:farnesyl-diphosphate farnesyltransferase